MPRQDSGFGLAAGWGFLLPHPSTSTSATSPVSAALTALCSLLLLPSMGCTSQEHAGCSPVNLLGNHVETT